MPNPIQVVLNTNDYQVVPETPNGGSTKDFFQGRDKEFASHKEALLQQIEQISRRFRGREDSAVEYVHVTLDQDAWAKTKRPTLSIFPPARTPLIGGAYLGDMIVELTPGNVGHVRGAIESAEIDVRVSPNKKGEPTPRPSRARSEVGAIKTLRMHAAADRRNFAASEAVEWFSDPRTGGMYVVEAFVDPRNILNVERDRRRIAQAALQELKNQLAAFEPHLEVQDTDERWQSTRFLLVKLTGKRVEDHAKLLRFLDDSPIVRRVSLPPILSTENSQQSVDPTGDAPIAIPQPEVGTTYPTLGIIDTGISSFSKIEDWCAGRVDPFEHVQQDRSHGTFIAGLATAAPLMNPFDICQEIPCKFFDLGLHPTNADSYEDFYPRGFVDFLEQLDVEIPQAKQVGVRVFNMSLSVKLPVAEDGYGYYASIIDEIADKHDVIIVLPTGNLDPEVWRPLWPDALKDVSEMLAGYRYPGQDRMFQPAESVRSISVGALGLPEENGLIRPAAYSRRGPSVALGVKPDVAHVGGHGKSGLDLQSINVDGQTTTGCGTSYAAPLAAKTVAALDHLIEGEMSRETLVGLLIHHSALPSPLHSASRYAQDFVGHGLPTIALKMLETSDQAITLTFTGVMRAQRELLFPFSWPSSLVTEKGACRGTAKLTLVYQAPIARQFGAEYVRINMDAYLRQEEIDKEGKVSWSGQLKSEGKIYEKHLIEHGRKWWPIKRYERTMPLGVGASSQWRLVVDSLCRTDFLFPSEGIPFSVILTIEDTTGVGAVFDELSRSLRTSGVRLNDIRTAFRVRTST